MEDQTVRTTSSQDRSPLLPLLGVVVAVLLVAAPWLILRFAPSPVEVTIAVVVVLLIALATLGYLAASRGQGAAFVAIALVLPYLVLASVVHGSAARASSELESIFDEDDLFDENFSDEDLSDEDFFDDDLPSEDGDGTYGSDPVLDALQDDCVDGDAAACEELYLESPVGSEYESVAIENGGGG